MKQLVQMVMNVLSGFPKWVWVAFGMVILLRIFIRLMSSPSRKGRVGERIVARRLRDLGAEYVIVNDVYLPTREGETTQIDHVIVSRYGIFVVETKNWTGWIFASGDSSRWTQSVYRKKSSFQNPIRQNYKHICELSRNLRIDKRYFISIVAVTGDCKFKTDMPDGVMFSRHAVEYVRSFDQPIMESGQVQEIVKALRDRQKAIPESVKRAHVANLRRRHG